MFCGSPAGYGIHGANPIADVAQCLIICSRQIRLEMPTSFELVRWQQCDPGPEYMPYCQYHYGIQTATDGLMPRE